MFYIDDNHEEDHSWGRNRSMPHWQSGWRFKPKTARVTKKKQAEPVRESTSTMEENDSNRGNEVEVDPAVREAIAYEVCQALHERIPGMLAEAVRSVGGKKDETKKKKPTPVMHVVAESKDE
jgi:hypothetical protein